MTSPSQHHTGGPGTGSLDDNFIAEPADEVATPAYPSPGAAGPDPLRSRTWSRLRAIIDLIVLYVASAVALLVDRHPYTHGAIWLVVGFPLLVMVVARTRRSSAERLRSGFVDIVAAVIAAVSISAMLLIVLASIVGISHPLQTVVRVWLYSCVYLGVAQYALVLIRRRMFASETTATPTIVVGAGVIGVHLASRLLTDPSYGLRPVGMLDPNPLGESRGTSNGTVPVLGTSSIGEAVRSTGARHVILAFSSEPDHLLAPKVRECQALGVEVSLIPRLYESINERTTLDHVGGLPLLTLHVVDPRGWQFGVKHAIDRMGAACGLLLASPLLLIVAAGVRLSSPGPILYRQRRVGRDGHEFDLLKFRSMRLAPDDAARATFVLTAGHAPGGIEGLDRRTRFGRWIRDLSLDELPQLLNVLRGDMSLVGPRPERPEYVARFTQEVVGYENRHRVRSGITGWAQVHGLRGQTSIADRVEWDNYYILNWSLRLDLRILLLTLAEVLRFNGS